MYFPQFGISNTTINPLLYSFCEIARKMPTCLNDKLTLVQVMAWCHQTTSHFLRQGWPRSVLAYDVTRPQWVKLKSRVTSSPSASCTVVLSFYILHWTQTTATVLLMQHFEMMEQVWKQNLTKIESLSDLWPSEWRSSTLYYMWRNFSHYGLQMTGHNTGILSHFTRWWHWASFLMISL